MSISVIISHCNCVSEYESNQSNCFSANVDLLHFTHERNIERNAAAEQRQSREYQHIRTHSDIHQIIAVCGIGAVRETAVRTVRVIVIFLFVVDIVVVSAFVSSSMSMLSDIAVGRTVGIVVGSEVGSREGS